MAFLDLAKERYSVRTFKSDPVEQEKLDLILEAARIAPTGKNAQPWRVYVLQSEGALAKVNELSRCIFGAPVVLLFTYDKTEDWHNPVEPDVHCGVEDVSIVATHAMLEAWELGVGSIWVNLFPNTQLERAFDIPPSERSVLLMPLGYAADDAHPAHLHGESRPLSELVRYL